jgi:hypothetical protein
LERKTTQGHKCEIKHFNQIFLQILKVSDFSKSKDQGFAKTLFVAQLFF